MSNFMKIHPVEAELFHADRWTEGRIGMTKPTGKMLTRLSKYNKHGNLEGLDVINEDNTV
jgi:hypothetical protein